MKEKFFNHIIFILFIVLLLVFSLQCFLLAFRVIEQEFLIQKMNQYIHSVYSNFTNQVWLVLLGLLLFSIAIYLIWLKQRVAQQQPYVKIATDDGEIIVSKLTLEQIILSILSDVDGVQDIKPEIQVQKDGNIKTLLQIMISNDCNIPDTAHLIQQKLKEELPRISGIEAKEVKINVNKISYQEDKENSK